MTVEVRRAVRIESGFSAVVSYMAGRAPFATMPLGDFIRTVSGAIKRGHYILAIEEGRVVGTVCWALCDGGRARLWMAGRLTPTFEETLDGDTVVLMLGGADHPRAVATGIRYVARLYPGRPYIMNRFGRGERRSVGTFPPTAGGL